MKRRRLPPHPMFSLTEQGRYHDWAVEGAKSIHVTASANAAWATETATLSLHWMSGANGPYSLSKTIAAGGGEQSLDETEVPPGMMTLRVILDDKNSVEAYTAIEVVVEEED